MTSPDPATPAPTIREAVAQYVEQLPPTTSPEQRQVIAAALHAILGSALDEPVGALTNLRMVVLSGLLKGRVSPKTGRPLADSTWRRYVLAGQSFAAWAAQRWPRAAAGGPSAAPAGEGPSAPQQHLGELVRILRVDAGLTRAALAAEARIIEPVLKGIELRRRLPTRRQLDRLTAAMPSLLPWAEREGVPIEVAPELPGVDGDKP